MSEPPGELEKPRCLGPRRASASVGVSKEAPQSNPQSSALLTRPPPPTKPPRGPPLTAQVPGIFPACSGEDGVLVMGVSGGKRNERAPKAAHRHLRSGQK